MEIEVLKNFVPAYMPEVQGGKRMGLNQCTFLGRLTRDPEIRYSSGAEQMPIARFTLAVDRRRKKDGESEADFFPCVAFDKRAEFAEKYLYCGIRVLVSGSMKNNNYTNKDGEKVYGVELQASHIEFADGKREEEKPTGAEQASLGQNGQAPANAGGDATRPKAAATRKPAVGDNGGGSAAGRTSEPSRQGAAPSRTTAGRSTSGRSSTGRPVSAGSRFSNVPEGMEEGNPFN